MCSNHFNQLDVAADFAGKTEQADFEVLMKPEYRPNSYVKSIFPHNSYKIVLLSNIKIGIYSVRVMSGNLGVFLLFSTNMRTRKALCSKKIFSTLQNILHFHILKSSAEFPECLADNPSALLHLKGHSLLR